MDFSAFSHGQIQSKLWLCEHLEPLITNASQIVILGSWYNVLGFLLLARNFNLYEKIVGIDLDQSSLEIANKICDAFIIHNNKIQNTKESANNINFDEFDVVICASTEDIVGDEWYNNIPHDKLICLQTLNLSPEIAKSYNNWNIVNPNYTFDSFKKKYPLRRILFEGEKMFDYGDLRYSRYMLIGKK